MTNEKQEAANRRKAFKAAQKLQKHVNEQKKLLAELAERDIRWQFSSDQ